jgi:hypothetical protein
MLAAKRRQLGGSSSVQKPRLLKKHGIGSSSIRILQATVELVGRYATHFNPSVPLSDVVS